MPSEGEQPWHSAFPTPSFDSKRITAAELVAIMEEKVAGKDYIVVDVRRTDFEVTPSRTREGGLRFLTIFDLPIPLAQDACIAGAVNMPAHSFYPTLETATHILSSIPLVIFHCQSCSPRGRGPRVAGWYAEELNNRGITSSRALVLDGGIKEFRGVCDTGGNISLVIILPKLT
jgi:arsenical-resistance protein 2